MLNGTTSVTYDVYNGNNEITNIDFDKLTISHNAQIPVTDVDIETLNADMSKYESMRIRIKKATVAASDVSPWDNTNNIQATLSQGTHQIILTKRVLLPCLLFRKMQ